jgi:hypothetical protein
MLPIKHTQVAQQGQPLRSEAVEAANRLSGFSQRQSPLSATVFAQMVILGGLENPEASLNPLAQSAEDLGVRVTAQALPERFTPQAVMLLAALFQASLQGLCQTDAVANETLQRFKGVKILDSTQLRLPLWLSGACYLKAGAYSALKRPLLFDLRYGQLSALALERADCPDQRCPLIQEQAQAGELFRFDRGYLSQET